MVYLDTNYPIIIFTYYKYSYHIIYLFLFFLSIKYFVTNATTLISRTFFPHTHTLLTLHQVQIFIVQFQYEKRKLSFFRKKKIYR